VRLIGGRVFDQIMLPRSLHRGHNYFFLVLVFKDANRFCRVAFLLMSITLYNVVTWHIHMFRKLFKKRTKLVNLIKQLIRLKKGLLDHCPR